MFEHTGTSKFDLTFSCKALSAGLILGIEYNADLFCEGRIRRMGGHFAQLVDSILADPSAAVCRLNMLPEDERIQLIDGFNHGCVVPAQAPWSNCWKRQRRRRRTRWR
jgi:non-ribosomal peptide synthetase component F